MSDDLLDDLEAENAETRRRALRSSDSLPPKYRRQAWVLGLGDGDWRVRREAIDAVVTHASGDPQMIDTLIDAALQGENVGLRNAALETLGRLGRQATAALRQRLAATTGGERKFLIEALGDTGDPEAVEDLVGLCDDPDPNVAAAAVDALARIGGDAAEGVLRARLISPQPFLRMAALDALVRLGARLPWAELAPILEDRFARRVAVPLLGRSGAMEAVAPLARMLEDASPHVTAQAVVALHELTVAVGAEPVRAQFTDERRAAIREQLRDGDRTTRRAAMVLALVGRDGEALDEAVAAAAEEALPPLAVEAIRQWGSEAVAPLLGVASRTSGTAKALALELAAELERGHAGASDVHPVLLGALDGSPPVVMAAALRGLVWHALPADMARILPLTTYPGEEVRAAALQVITTLGERAPDVVVRIAEGLPVEQLGPALPRLLARLGGPRSLETLRAALASGDAALRRACVDALGEFEGQASLDLIVLSLTDEDPSVRETAAAVLGRTGAGKEALLHALKAEGEDPEVRVALVRALSGVSGPEVEAALVQQLEDEAPRVVVAALEELVARRSPDLARHVRRALEHGDAEVVTGALHALDVLPSREGRRVAETLLARHKVWRVRAHAARVLAAFEGVAGVLQTRLQHESNETVREAIREALAQVRGG